jgi:hypothetical protein
MADAIEDQFATPKWSWKQEIHFGRREEDSAAGPISDNDQQREQQNARLKKSSRHLGIRLIPEEEEDHHRTERQGHHSQRQDKPQNAFSRSGGPRKLTPARFELQAPKQLQRGMKESCHQALSAPGEPS